MNEDTSTTAAAGPARFAVNRRRFLGVAGAAIAAAGIGEIRPASARAATGSSPAVVPALQQWEASHGWYSFGPNSRIVAPDSLRDLAATFADDLRQLTGRRPNIVAGAGRPGDLVLAVGSGGRDYTMRVEDRVSIVAATKLGIFHGTRTVLQLLRQGNRIPRGLATDWAETPARELMVDVGRKYYSLPWLYDRIRELAYLKYDSFHLHLTDDEGFRIESSTHPEVVSAQHYTKAQIRDLIEFAARYHVQIIPEIDMPGHMTQILNAHPELRLVGADGTVKAGSLDLSQPAAYTLAQSLIEEYLPLFPAPYWHLGADEWLPESQIDNFPQLDAYAKAHFGPAARARDAYFAFINWADDLVRPHGKTLRIWNDQLVTGYQVQVNSDIVIEYWFPSDFMPAQILYERGNPLVNADWNSLYYVLGVTHPDPADIYSGFSPTRFADGFRGQPAGVEFSIWANPPEEEDENVVAFGIGMPLRALAQAAWGSPKPVDDFDAWVPTLDLIGHAPGYTGVDEPSIGSPSSSIPAMAAYPLTNLVDGRPGTYFVPARPVRRNDEITIDLRATITAGQINVRMRPDAAVHRAVVELSSDGRQWHTAGQLSGQSEVHILLPAGEPARYARLRILAPQSVRPAIGEFGITPLAARAGGLSTSLPAYQDNTLDHVADADPATFFWSSRGARTDDYLALDLGGITPVNTITLLMANPPGNRTDYLHNGLLEVSPDGSQWTVLQSFTDQPTLTVNAPAGTTARYVRARCTQGQGDWVIFRQFTAS